MLATMKKIKIRRALCTPSFLTTKLITQSCEVEHKQHLEWSVLADFLNYNNSIIKAGKKLTYIVALIRFLFEDGICLLNHNLVSQVSLRIHEDNFVF